jgi:replicative DNA helicase
MSQTTAVSDQLEVPEMSVARTRTSEALNITEILRRAREIHRQHGGLFGYDYEDWVQAWERGQETAEENAVSEANWQRSSGNECKEQ